METNMLLSYHDIDTIEKIGYTKDFFVVEDDGWLQLKNHHGRCVFHNGTYCTIYQQRPTGCHLYPVVYDNDDKSALLDNECPQRHCFTLSKRKTHQLTTLVSLLEQERTDRIREKNHAIKNK